MTEPNNYKNIVFLYKNNGFVIETTNKEDCIRFINKNNVIFLNSSTNINQYVYRVIDFIKSFIISKYTTNDVKWIIKPFDTHNESHKELYIYYSRIISLSSLHLNTRCKHLIDLCKTLVLEIYNNNYLSDIVVISFEKFL